MKIEAQWILLQIGQLVAGLVLPVVLMLCLGRPRRWLPRAALVTTLCAFALLLLVVIQHFTIGTYSPLRSEISDDAVTKKDLVASIIMAWILPLSSLGALELCRWFSQLQRDAT